DEEKSPDILVIGADTVVSTDNKILGKPDSYEAAYDMLNELQGRTHEVYTGVTFVYNEGNEVKQSTFFECTRVTFFEMSDREIKDYIRTGEPMDKAGAYGIQGLCAVYIKEIAGDYNNVVGLPIAKVYQKLKELRLLERI
ncbi:MAG: septum formation protein Maf, partial [Lachnospiraceae bacterium]|nr:septum formation protein Maf [Lachnospiraceae bacterium]